MSVLSELLRDFVEDCRVKFSIKSLPKIVFTKNKSRTKTLGHNDVGRNDVVVYVGDRLLADVLRTLAHELVHTAQYEQGLIKPDSGSTGSPEENHANSMAGVVLRNFGEKHPTIYEKTFDTILSEAKESYDYGCLMLRFTVKNWSEVQEMVLEEDIDVAAGGRETEPHVTVLYGFLPDTDTDDVRIAISEISPKPVYLLGISTFENEEFDVVKFDVRSQYLHRLHDDLKDRFPNEETYPDYQPHMTIAYVKKGTGKKYEKRFRRPQLVTPKGYIFSKPNGKKIQF